MEPATATILTFHCAALRNLTMRPSEDWARLPPPRPVRILSWASDEMAARRRDTLLDLQGGGVLYVGGGRPQRCKLYGTVIQLR